MWQTDRQTDRTAFANSAFQRYRIAWIWTVSGEITVGHATPIHDNRNEKSLCVNSRRLLCKSHYWRGFAERPSGRAGCVITWWAHRYLRTLLRSVMPVGAVLLLPSQYIVFFYLYVDAASLLGIMTESASRWISRPLRQSPLDCRLSACLSLPDPRSAASGYTHVAVFVDINCIRLSQSSRTVPHSRRHTAFSRHTAHCSQVRSTMVSVGIATLWSYILVIISKNCHLYSAIESKINWRLLNFCHSWLIVMGARKKNPACAHAYWAQHRNITRFGLSMSSVVVEKLSRVIN